MCCFGRYLKEDGQDAVAGACNLLGGGGWEDFSLRSAWKNVLETPSQPTKAGLCSTHLSFQLSEIVMKASMGIK
jgi:hypothetical protein